MTKAEFQKLDYDERRRLVIEALKQLAAERGGVLRRKEWRREKPDWCPTAGWAAAYVQCVTEDEYRETIKTQLSSWVKAMDVLGIHTVTKYKPKFTAGKKRPTKILDEIEAAWDYVDSMWKFKPRKDKPRDPDTES